MAEGNSIGAAPGTPAPLPHILHVGCGGNRLPEWIVGTEVRFDIDPQHQPDIVGTMTDMGDIGPFDVVYNSHSLEHLYPHEVPTALAEFLRVLRPGGAAIILVPDLEDVRATEDVLYLAPAGPMTGLDLIYGCRKLIPTMPYMAHHTGFIAATLAAALKAAGFVRISTIRGGDHSLMGVGFRA